MSEGKIQDLERKIDNIANLVEKALIAARESTTPSFSRMMDDLKSDFRKEMKNFKAEVGEKFAAMEKKMEPSVSAFETAGKIRRWTINIAGFILALTAIVAPIIEFREWWKK